MHHPFTKVEINRDRKYVYLMQWQRLMHHFLSMSRLMYLRLMVTSKTGQDKPTQEREHLEYVFGCCSTHLQGMTAATGCRCTAFTCQGIETNMHTS